MHSKKLLWLVPLFAMAACGNGRRNTEDYADKSVTVRADSTEAAAGKMPPAGNATAAPPLNSPDRKIKRTADFHCKVQNVFNSTTRLEQLVKASGGAVLESQIQNSNSEIKTSYYKPDSLKQTQTYTTTALLTLKVPAQYLDTIINAIPGLTNFIDSRTLRQSDITYQYLANELKNNADETNAASAMKLAKKSKDALEVQRYDADRQDEHISRKIENLQIMDDVTYATVTVAFSQPEQVFVQTIVNPGYITRVSFTMRSEAALREGADMISEIFVGLVSIWPLLLLTIAGWIVYRKMRQRKLALNIRQA